MQLKDLDLVGWMRVAFKPLTGAMLPSFGAITIALQEEVPFFQFFFFVFFCPLPLLRSLSCSSLGQGFLNHAHCCDLVNPLKP